MSIKKSIMFNKNMQIAINLAMLKTDNKDKKKSEIPVGCVIVDDDTGKILAKSCNKTREKNNPTQHAEIICINRALKKINKDRLNNCSMYVTLEPCGMCAGAIALSKVDKLYIGCLSKKTGAVISNECYFNSKICNHRPKVFYPIMEDECQRLITNFFKKFKNIN